MSTSPDTVVITYGGPDVAVIVIGEQGPPGAAFTWTTVKTANYTAVSTDLGIPVDSTGGAVTISMPANPTDAEYKCIADVGGAAFANPITVDGNGHTLAGAATMVLPGAWATLEFRYNATKGVWVPV